MSLDLKALRDKRVKAKERMDAVLTKVKADNRDTLTEEEKADYAAAKKDYVDAGDSIEYEEFRVEADETLREVRPRVARVIPGEPVKKEFDSFQEFTGAVIQAKTGRKVDARLEYAADASMGEGSTGGFAVPKKFSTDIMKADAQGAVLRPLCRELPAGDPPDGEISFPALDQSTTQNIYGGVSIGWTEVEKDSDLPETNAALRMVTMKPHSIAGTIELTNKLIQNWSGAGGFYSGLLQEALIHALEKAIRNGNGMAQPLGFQSSANGALLKQARGTGSHVKYADLVAMEQKSFGNNLKWIISRRAIPDFRLMEDTEGHLVFAADAVGALPKTIFGYPYVIDNRGPALGSLGDVVLGDFSHYLCKPGSGPFMDVSDQVNFRRYRTVIRLVANFDGQPWLKDPIESENESSTVSPFVALDVP